MTSADDLRKLIDAPREYGLAPLSTLTSMSELDAPRAATSEGKVLDSEGRLYAHATTSCLVFDVPAGG